MRTIRQQITILQSIQDMRRLRTELTSMSHVTEKWQTFQCRQRQRRPNMRSNFHSYDPNSKPRREDVVLMDIEPNKTNPLVKESHTNVLNYATGKVNNTKMNKEEPVNSFNYTAANKMTSMNINKEELAKARLKHIIETQGSKGFKAITENELYSDMKF